ncbi:MAG: terpene cyclase/mutase family protein [Dehalococcoidales bacterium]|nr:MAG: terpene cyclase/mutase family protein [Dehalococcoidales bacterium]
MPDYILKYDPIPSIFEKGNSYHKLKALSFLAERDDSRLLDVLQRVKSSQNADGGWPWLGRWEFDEKVPSSISDTAYYLPPLVDCGVDIHSEEVVKASAFLLKAQSDDGGWAENPELRKTMEESWTWFSVDHSVTWITGLVINTLLKAGHPLDASSIVKAVTFLKSMQNDEGGWPSHASVPEPSSTEMWTMEEVISALLNCGETKDSEIIKKAESTILNHRDRWQEPVENPLGVFLMLGYDRGHEYVAKCIGHLLENQKEDGGWGYYNEWDSSPDQTVRWLEVLLEYGVRIG